MFPIRHDDWGRGGRVKIKGGRDSGDGGDDLMSIAVFVTSIDSTQCHP